MPLYGADSFLGWMDNWRRVAAKNVRDLVEDPQNALSKTLHASVDTIDQTMRDPMNFVGAGIIKSAIYNKAISKLKLYFDEDAMKEITNPIFYKARDRVVLMSPKSFLTAAEEGIDPVKTAETAARFAKGDKLPEYRIPEMFVDSKGKMYGHEGRHRVRELEKRGVELVPVRIRSDNIRFSEQGTGKFDDLGSMYPSIMTTERFEKRDFPIPREEVLLPNAGILDPILEEQLLNSIIK